MALQDENVTERAELLPLNVQNIVPVCTSQTFIQCKMNKIDASEAASKSLIW
jgi:hypothetical protein